jgi:MFS family permease
VLRSRKKALALFIVILALAIVAYFTLGGLSMFAFYAVCVGIGVGGGYWAVFMTTAAESFGTNLRATVTTTAPNLVRGSVLPMTWLFQAGTPAFGMLGSAAAVGVVAFVLAGVSWWFLEETYGRDLDFTEE